MKNLIKNYPITTLYYTGIFFIFLAFLFDQNLPAGIAFIGIGVIFHVVAKLIQMDVDNPYNN